jgi:preprotein translocase subunit SecD
MFQRQLILRLLGIVLITVVASLIALPPTWSYQLQLPGRTLPIEWRTPQFSIPGTSSYFSLARPLRLGLDIQGGMEVVLKADMSQIAEADRVAALESARDIISRRVDLFGVNEPVIKTLQQGDEYRIQVQLPGVTDPDQALQLVGQTAVLSFRLPAEVTEQQATAGGMVSLDNLFTATELTGKNLKRATVQFDPQTQQPVIGLEFDSQGQQLFGDITSQHVGKALAIFIDQSIVTMPVIQTPILDGRAVISGTFSLEEAKQLAIQLNAGALPVPITVLEQRTVGPTLGQEAVEGSIKAGLVGILAVMVFLIVIYKLRGVLATISLVIYGVITLAVYKWLGVTLTVPGIAGLLLSVGMAVDSTILIFERIKDEQRLGKTFNQALELGFGRAWNSIKDANVATAVTAFILINPLDLPFLNSSGLVRGFGVTLLLGIVMSLFTGVVVMRTLLRLFLKDNRP